MVTTLRLLYLIFFLPLVAWGDDTQINASMSEYGLVENQPLKGTITVTHNAQTPIDATSFRMDGKPLTATFQQDVKMSSTSPLTLSMYGFELAPHPKGLHLLPEISVKVGGKTYKTIPSSFEVTGAAGAAAPAAAPVPAGTPAPASTPAPAPAAAQSTNAYLKLEARVDGTQPFYPHQRVNFVYRYLFNGNIDLTEEHLPMLDAEGFRKVGDVQVHDDIFETHNLHEITQVVEAINPGKFSFGPSYIEGKAYTEDALGKKNYLPNKLRSEAPIISVTVDPFPETGKPPSFNGAIGQYIYKVAMTSPGTVSVGDKVLLTVELTGNPLDIENVPLPEICCQPGMSGLFKMSDLPPASVVKGPTKQFLVELRPLSTQIKEIPSLEFSSFNPESKTYTVQHSDPIPLNVLPQKDGAAPPPQETKTQQYTTPNTTPQPIEIAGPYEMESTDLDNKLLATWWSLLLIPIGAFAVYYQNYLRNQQIKKEGEIKKVSSQEFFDEAMKSPPGSARFYDLTNKAFIALLAERGDIPNTNTDPEKLPKTGTGGEVREFLLRIEENRFAGKEAFNPELVEEARRLFSSLHVEVVS